MDCLQSVFQFVLGKGLGLFYVEPNVELQGPSHIACVQHTEKIVQ